MRCGATWIAGRAFLARVATRFHERVVRDDCDAWMRRRVMTTPGPAAGRATAPRVRG
jgi:hypothetical protein